MCSKCDKDETDKSKCEDSVAFKAGVASMDALVGGLGILGRGSVWLSRQVANGTAAAGRGISAEYKRQQAHGFSKDDK